VVSLVPLGALAALGGAYSSATLPLLVAAAAAFFISGARIAARHDTRAADAALAAVVGVIVLQLVPLPAAVASVLSPQAWPLQNFLSLQPFLTTRPLTIDSRLTREGLAAISSAVLLFWAARETFTRGGVRWFARAIAWGGFVAALVGLVQRATAPHTLLWRWAPLDPGALPFGPFVNRNHFATWLLMASAVTAGYLVAHLRSHRFDHHLSKRLILRDLLADGSALMLFGSLGAMVLALVTSLSRAALVGAIAALLFGIVRARRSGTKERSMVAAGVAVAALLALAVWANREGLAERLETTRTPEVGRPVIWAETMPLVGDFWLTGTGVGTYAQAMLKYQRTRIGTLFNDAHSEYLQLLAEGGVLLTAAVLVALWYWLRVARQRLAQDTHELLWIRVGAAAGLCGLAVQSLFDSPLRMPANALLAAALAALVTHEPRWLVDEEHGISTGGDGA
jgi:O-antigen ligase